MMEKRYTAAFFLILGGGLVIGDTWLSIIVAMVMLGAACRLVFGKEREE